MHIGCLFYDGMHTPKCKWVKRAFRPTGGYNCNGAWYIETKQENVKQENVDDSSSTSSSETTIPEPRPEKKILLPKKNNKKVYYPWGYPSRECPISENSLCARHAHRPLGEGNSEFVTES
jgi:hypothetical protein